ncbi:MAG: glutamate synthase subunit alpha, partial [Cyanobacteriota bacterium]
LDYFIGRNDLRRQRQVTRTKPTSQDLTSLLGPRPQATDRSSILHDPEAHGNGPILEEGLLADPEVLQAIETHGRVSRSLAIVNTDRSVGTRLAGEIAGRHGDTGFLGELDLTLIGAAGQSFGAFLLQGMHLQLVGEANDYVGKGMNGGTLTLIPPPGRTDPEDQVILGNTCLYGATGGELYARGRAGERFAVRNSGAKTVVEGTGDHCCEYMTGGVVVVLGSTGRNVAAGMTGGVAFLLDEENSLGRLLNPDTVAIHPLSTPEQDALLRPLLEEHARRTGSHRAAAILKDWASWQGRFKVLVPPSELATVGLAQREQVVV